MINEGRNPIFQGRLFSSIGIAQAGGFALADEVGDGGDIEHDFGGQVHRFAVEAWEQVPSKASVSLKLSRSQGSR